MRPPISEGHKLLAHNVRRWRELRGIDTDMLARTVGWPLAMIEDIESAKQFDITLNDVEQLADALAVLSFELFVPLKASLMRPRMKHPEAPRLLARNVWRFREQRRITASALAEKLDWPLVEIDKIENGDKPDLTLDDLERLALVLHLEPADLLRRSVQQ